MWTEDTPASSVRRVAGGSELPSVTVQFCLVFSGLELVLLPWRRAGGCTGLYVECEAGEAGSQGAAGFCIARWSEVTPRDAEVQHHCSGTSLALSEGTGPGRQLSRKPALENANRWVLL